MNGNIKYFLCYDVELNGFGTSTRRKGKQEVHIHPYDRGFALSVCENLVSIYGEGTHWIEDETGERIE